MSHCSINLEDAPDGLINLRVVFTDGHQPNSHAHKMAGQIVKFLDEQAASKKETPNDQQE